MWCRMFSIEYNENNLDNIYDHFLNKFNNNIDLKNHRFYIESNNLGYGERAFHAMWDEIILSFNDIKFLEIGVYKGQTISLVKMLMRLYHKKGTVLGVTPLNNTGDKYSTYDQTNYEPIIKNLFNYFNLDFDINNEILKGLSTDKEIISKLKKQKFNIIYVDGGHDYNTVISDIDLCLEILENNGLIVFDDCSNFKKFNKNLFLGHYEVALAIRDKLENNKNYQEIMCVGHNRVFRKK